MPFRLVFWPIFLGDNEFYYFSQFLQFSQLRAILDIVLERIKADVAVSGELADEAHFGSEIKLLEWLDNFFFFAYRLLHRMVVNVEISSRFVNCQLYQIKGPKNDFRCRFQTNSAAKQTQAYCWYSLPHVHGEFWRENRCGGTRFTIVFWFNVSTHALFEFSMCEIFLSILMSFLIEFRYSILKWLLFNQILNCFVQCTKMLTNQMYQLLFLKT